MMKLYDFESYDFVAYEAFPSISGHTKPLEQSGQELKRPFLLPVVKKKSKIHICIKIKMWI